MMDRLKKLVCLVLNALFCFLSMPLGAKAIDISEINHKVCVRENAETLVLIHGSKSSMETFDGVFNELCETFTVLAYDQRGHGASAESEDASYRLQDYADDLETLLAHLSEDANFGFQFRQVHLLGHSFGARNALFFADKYPHRVLSLTLEDMGVSSFDETDEAQDVFNRALFARAGYRDYYDSLADVQQYLQQMFGQTALKALMRKIVKESSGDGGNIFRLKFKPHVSMLYHYYCANFDFTEILRKLQIPILLLKAGSPESAVSKQEMLVMITAAQQLSMVSVQGAKHSIHKSHPSDFVGYLTTFILNSARAELERLTACYRMSSPSRISPSRFSPMQIATSSFNGVVTLGRCGSLSHFSIQETPETKIGDSNNPNNPEILWAPRKEPSLRHFTLDAPIPLSFDEFEE